jgi:hypothetical protein
MDTPKFSWTPILDCIDTLDKDEIQDTFERRFRVSKFEYMASKTNQQVNTYELKGYLRKLMDVYGEEMPDIQAILTDCETDITFKEGLNRKEFENDMFIFIGAYVGIERYLCDYIHNTSGNRHMSIDYAMDELYKYYESYGAKSIDVLFEHCREEGYLHFMEYAHPDMHTTDINEYRERVKHIEIAPPPEIPKWE